MINNVDKAGEKYWTTVWENTELPHAIDVTNKSFTNHTNLEFHKFFCELFNGFDTRGKKLLEIGCGNSVWLPYFAKTFGFEVSGIDYSQNGCEKSKLILSREEIKGEIYCMDAFNAPEQLQNKYDVVISMGVVEHFENLKNTLSAFQVYLVRDGLLISTVPNNTMLLGWLQKKINKPIYDIHYIYDLSDLEKAYGEIGQITIKQQYLVCLNLHVNLEAKNNKEISFRLIKIYLNKFLSLINFVVYQIDSKIIRLKRTKTFSSAMVFVGSKK